MANLIETVADIKAFKVLQQALRATGLDDTLSELGPFTLFAPTDEAFARLPDGALETMFKDIPRLRAALTRHIAPGVISMIDAMQAVSPKTLSGQPLSFASTNGLTVDNARITTADITADNGVLHIIDEVITEKPPRNN